MNKRRLSKSQHKRYSIYPPARRIGADGTEYPRIDDAWLVTEATPKLLILRNPRSDQHVPLETAHVHHHAPDNGRSDGILHLKKQICVFAPAGYAVEPFSGIAATPRTGSATGR
jgi:hypothetical protein